MTLCYSCDKIEKNIYFLKEFIWLRLWERIHFEVFLWILNEVHNLVSA